MRDYLTGGDLRTAPPRRWWFKPVLIAATLSMVVAASGSTLTAAQSTQETTGKVVMNISTGAFADAQKWAWVNPFIGETGYEVILDEREPDLAVLTAMLESGQTPTIDLYHAVPNGIPGEDYPKYLEPIDWSVVNQDDLVPGFYGDTWVASSIDSYILGYNTKTTNGVVPDGWADLFDLEKIPGNRMFEDRWETTCMITLLADGVAPDQLIPIDVERCLAKLQPIRDNIVWFKSGSENQELLASGEVAMGMAFNGRVKRAVDDGAPVGAVWDHQLVEFAQFGVVKGAPNKAAAMEYIAFATNRENAGALTEFLPYPGANKYQTIHPAAVAWVPNAHFDLPYAQIDSATKDWANAHYEEYNPLFQAFKTGG